MRSRLIIAQTGTHLMVSGIVLQLVVLLVFSAIGLDMLRRGRKHPIANPQPGVDLRRLAIGMVIADLALIVRGIYRKSSSCVVAVLDVR